MLFRSMGGWLMLLVARALGRQVQGMVGVAAAPDFTDWGYTDAKKGHLQKYGRIEQLSDYGAPMVTTLGF